MPSVYPQNAIVTTPYGLGLVVSPGSTTPSGTPVVPASLSLTSWTLSDGTHPLLHTHDRSWAVKVQAPQVKALVVGDDVTTPYGRGRVAGIEAEGKVHVVLSDWRLAYRSRVHCYFSPDVCKFAPRKKYGEMNVMDKIDAANERREDCKALIAEKRYAEALVLYNQGLFIVNQITHDEAKLNDERGSLLECMVAILNNLALCNLKEKQYSDCISNATNAIMLIDAVASKTGGKVHQSIVSLPDMSDKKFFVDWRAKSLYYIAQSRAFLGDYAVAAELLKRAMTLTFGHEDLKGMDASIKKLLVECNSKKVKDDKKQKEAAMKMFGGGSSSPKKKEENNNKNKEEENIASPQPAIAKTSSLPTASSTLKTKITNKAAGPTPPADATVSSENASADVIDAGKRKEVEKSVAKNGNARRKKGRPARRGGREEAEEEEEEAVLGGDGGEASALPWYKEHEEAFILAGIGALVIGGVAIARSFLRR